MDTPSCLPCFHPTLTLLVDDDPGFLRALTLDLDPALAVRPLVSPLEALDLVRSGSKETYNPCLSRGDLVPNIEQLYRLERFGEVSVVVVDYDMPHMNGLEFCQQLIGAGVMTILLTGKADEKLAVRSFNDGLIDRYVRKQDPDATQLLEQYIQGLQQKYFHQALISKPAPTTDGGVAPFTGDPELAPFLWESSKAWGVVEYYMMSEPKGFLLVDADGRARHLLVQTAEDLDIHAEFLREEGGPADIITAVTEGKVLPRFNTPDGYYRDGEAYETVPAQPVGNSGKYFYALREFAPPQVDAQRIRSYNEYLDELDKMLE